METSSNEMRNENLEELDPLANHHNAAMTLATTFPLAFRNYVQGNRNYTFFR